jgi:hypothetical protein
LARCWLHLSGPEVEAASKPHLASDSCVADLFRWLIPPAAGLRFFIGLRLALERDLRF